MLIDARSVGAPGAAMVVRSSPARVASTCLGIALLTPLVACGQKGPLVLPPASGTPSATASAASAASAPRVP